MNNTKEQLMEAGWREDIAEYFLEYAKNSRLLSKVDLRLVPELGTLEAVKSYIC